MLRLRQAKVVGLFFGGLNAASTISVIVVVIYCAYLTITGSTTVGSITSFILYSLTERYRSTNSIMVAKKTNFVSNC